MTVEKAKGIHCSVDPAHTRVEMQNKERDVLGFKLQKSPWSPSVPKHSFSGCMWPYIGAGHSTKHTTTKCNANLLFMVPAQAWWGTTVTWKSQMAFRLAVTNNTFHFNSMQGIHSALQTLINPHSPVGMQKNSIPHHHKGKIAPAWNMATL